VGLNGASNGAALWCCTSRCLPAVLPVVQAGFLCSCRLTLNGAVLCLDAYGAGLGCALHLNGARDLDAWKRCDSIPASSYLGSVGLLRSGYPFLQSSMTEPLTLSVESLLATYSLVKETP